MQSIYLLALVALLASNYGLGDSVVQVNVNRPFNDVNEKFISFAMKPEDLYRALDGSHRREMTRMAALLENSYIKFLDDFNFVENAEPPLRTSNRIIWRGFNRWTKAVNWTMITPVPYKPDSWNPLQVLKILNQTHSLGITECMWQLGTDFGSSHAADYVADLKTFNLMVDSFRPYVDDWQIMGADVSVGSNPEETKRYIEMSRDLNAAFGWTQPTSMVASSNMGSYIYESDPALQVLLKNKVPVWLNLPEKVQSKRRARQGHNNHISGSEINDALRWAQTLGDAASSGFDVIFKRINNGDWEHPDFSFFVTVLFKKVMGARVFPARPLKNTFTAKNKLYTHCANDVSGGLAFMVANGDDEPMEVTIRTLTKLSVTTAWQYTLTTRKGQVMLNNNRIALNSTIRPEIKRLTGSKNIELETPARSVSFWVLPEVDLEQCQYTEIDADEEDVDDDMDSESAESVDSEQHLTSADRLLRELIYETSLQHSPVARSRKRRFVLEAASAEEQPAAPAFGTLLQNFGLKEKTVNKRESKPTEHRSAALDWLKQWVGNSFNPDNFELPLLKRHARSSDNLFGSLSGKRTPITRKIFDIKKPERNVKPLFDLEDFDEEEFFKKISEHTEPPYTRLPEGDVHMKHIARPDGEEEDDEEMEQNQKAKSSIKQKPAKQEVVNEMKPLRLLPTEFYEALPQMLQPPKGEQTMSTGHLLNSLLFPEPFSKKQDNDNKKKSLKSKAESEGIARKLEMAKKQIKQQKQQQQEDGRNLFTRDFLRAQRELSRAFPNDFGLKESDENVNDKQLVTDDQEDTEDMNEQTRVSNAEADSAEDSAADNNRQPAQFNPGNFNFFGENFENLFAPLKKTNTQKVKETEQKQKAVEEQKPETVNADVESDEEDKSKASAERPWWELSHLRSKRALHWDFPSEAIETNMISKYDDFVKPLGRSIVPEQLANAYKYEVINEKLNKVPEEHTEQPITLPHKIVTTMKAKVSAIFDIVTGHVGQWYQALIKHSNTNKLKDVNDATAVANTIA